RAAARGGVTTLIDMPLNSIPATTTVAALEIKRAAARDRCHVDVGFWGGVIPGNSGELAGLVAAGVRGFKAFLVDSGVDEFPAASLADLEKALRILGPLGVPLLVHAEDPTIVSWQADQLREDPCAHAAWAASRAGAEEAAVARLIELAGRCAGAVHIVHVSTAGAVEQLREARRHGVSVTAETCPHYLVLRAEDVPAGGTAFKCAPPLGSAADREALWRGLLDGTLSMVVSDHSPCPPDLKELESGRFDLAWGGIASLQVSWSAVWTEARRREIDLMRLVEWMSVAPARLAGLTGRKGVIATGADADLMVVDPEARFVIDPEQLAHRHRVTPWTGKTLSGLIVATFLRGEPIFGEGQPSTPQGRLL
ncbi:MAG: allantoinase, partial [bacterium]